VTLEGRK
jgi:hypothetical protein